MNDYLTVTGYGFTTNDVNEKEITAKALLKVLDFAPRFKSWLEEVGCCPHEFSFTGKEDSNQNPNVVVVGQNKEPVSVIEWLNILEEDYPDDVYQMSLPRILYAALNEHAMALGYGELLFDSLTENETDNPYILYVQRFPWEITNPLEKELTPEKMDQDLFLPVLTAFGVPNASSLLDKFCIEVG